MWEGPSHCMDLASGPGGHKRAGRISHGKHHSNRNSFMASIQFLSLGSCLEFLPRFLFMVNGELQSERALFSPSGCFWLQLLYHCNGEQTEGNLINSLPSVSYNWSMKKLYVFILSLAEIFLLSFEGIT